MVESVPAWRGIASVRVGYNRAVRLRWGWMAVGAILAFFAAGCGAEGTVSTVNVMGQAESATTQADTARVTETLSFRQEPPGSTNSATTTGDYDFVHHDGTMTSTSSGQVGTKSATIITGGMVYQSASSGMSSFGLPSDKHWISEPIPSGTGPSAPVDSLLEPWGATDPSAVLSELSSLATSVTRVGRQTLDGVAVTEYSILLKPIHAANCQTAQFGPAHPLKLWLDNEQRARQVQIQLAYPSHRISGTPVSSPAIAVTVTVDDDDFGIPVSAVAPPPAQVETNQQLQELVQRTAAKTPHGATAKMVATC